MRRLIVYEFMGLGGVAQAPGAPGEDRSGGVQHGGWHLRYSSMTSPRSGRSRA